MRTNPVGIVNLVSAFLVLIAGFYALIFLPVPLSGVGRIVIGTLLVLYFLWRLKHYSWRYGKRSESMSESLTDQDKIT
jgi:hypothetical protein